jgi:hypothetical protein
MVGSDRVLQVQREITARMFNVFQQIAPNGLGSGLEY